jgi:hypothetical protein
MERKRHSSILGRLAAALVMMVAATGIKPSPVSASNLQQVNRLAFQCQSGRRKACSELEEIAQKDKDARVRNVAVAQLTDQPLLARIAVEDQDAGVRSAAVARLADKALLAKIAAEDKDAGVRAAAVAATAQVERDITEGRDIVNLVREKKIEFQARGGGIQVVSVRIRRLVPYPVTVRIPVASIFVAYNPAAQNMVTTAEDKVQLGTDKWVSVSSAAACANRLRREPRSGDEFAEVRSPDQGELGRLMPALERARVEAATRQAAVWIVTDNATYLDLGILLARQKGIGGSRAINEQESARAMKICDEAGIDITRKAIWEDRQRIFMGLGEGELKTWLSHKQ